MKIHMINRLSAIALSLLMVSCAVKQNEPVVEAESGNKQLIVSSEKRKLSNIKTGAIQYEAMRSLVSCKGMVEAAPGNIARVSVPMDGYVKHIYIHNGETLQKGDRLMSIEHPQFIVLQKDYLKAASELKRLEKEYNRQKLLYEKEAGRNKDYESVSAAYEQIRIDKKALAQQLKLLNINTANLSIESLSAVVYLNAPINGTVNEINVAIGQYLSADLVLFEMIGNDHFHLELQVFEKDIHQLAIGQSLSFECVNPNSHVGDHTAEIIGIGKSVDRLSKTFKVHAKPADNYPGLLHGMYIDANIIIQSDSAFVLPELAVVSDDQSSYVLLKSNDSLFIPLKVTTGYVAANMIEIVNYNELVGKDVVTQGANLLWADFNSEE